jgi:hypothetical protein
VTRATAGEESATGSLGGGGCGATAGEGIGAKIPCCRRRGDAAVPCGARSLFFLVLFWPSGLLRFKDLEDAREKLEEKIQNLFLR